MPEFVGECVRYPLKYILKTKTLEKGCWLRQDINNRKCTLCNTNEVGDECHYIFKCPLFTEDRNSILPTRLCKNPNMCTVQNLMNTVENYWNYASLYQSSYNM